MAGDLAKSLGLSWSDREYDLVEFLDIYPLPQVVQVAEGNYGVSEETTLPAGQTLTLHVQRETKMFHGYTYEGEDIYVPLNCPQKVEVRPQNVSLMYDTVEELCTVLKRVQFVRVTKDHTNRIDPTRNLKAGQKLKLLYLNKAVTPRRLICVDENGCELCLTMDVTGGFQPLLNNNEYFLMELPELFALPIYVQFTSPPRFNMSANTAAKFNTKHLLGLIQLDDVVAETTVIASTRESGGKTILTFPRTLDVSFIVPEQALQKDTTYARVCDSLNDGVDLVKVEAAALPKDDEIYSTRPQLIREFSYRRCLASEPKAVTSSGTAATITEVSNEEDDDDSHEYIDIDEAIDRETYEEIDKVFVQGYRPPRMTPYEIERDEGDDDYEDATRMMPQMTRDNVVDTEYTPPQIDRDSINSTKAHLTHVTKNNSTTNNSPQNPQHLRDVQTTNVWEMTVAEVVLLLEALNMRQYGEVFEGQQVDGAMLKELDKTILQGQPFNMNPFHALKLMKAAEDNWRPNTDT